MPIVLGPYVQNWPETWQDHFVERLAIMAAEGVPDAERKAEADIRRRAETEGQDVLFGEPKAC